MGRARRLSVQPWPPSARLACFLTPAGQPAAPPLWWTCTLPTVESAPCRHRARPSRRTHSCPGQRPRAGERARVRPARAPPLVVSGVSRRYGHRVALSPSISPCPPGSAWRCWARTGPQVDPAPHRGRAGHAEHWPGQLRRPGDVRGRPGGPDRDRRGRRPGQRLPGPDRPGAPPAGLGGALAKAAWPRAWWTGRWPSAGWRATAGRCPEPVQAGQLRPWSWPRCWSGRCG